MLQNWLHGSLRLLLLLLLIMTMQSISVVCSWLLLSIVDCIALYQDGSRSYPDGV